MPRRLHLEVELPDTVIQTPIRGHCRRRLASQRDTVTDSLPKSFQYFIIAWPS